MFRRYLFLFLTLATVILTACREEQVSADPTLSLTFSRDTLRFDTVFTTAGSSTQIVMVYNRNRHAVRIDRVSNSTPYFRLNLDGENDPARLNNIVLNGGDSIYLFVRATVGEQHSDAPVYITDSIVFALNDHEQKLRMEVCGQDVHLVRNDNRHTRVTDYHFTSNRPYLIFDTLTITGTTRMDAGATLYMHSGAVLNSMGDVRARGTLEHPIRITSDRMDRLFEHVPYRMASGQWEGWYINDTTHAARLDTINYVEIRNGNIGLYVWSDAPDRRRQVVLSNSLIHNHALYGVVLRNTDAVVWNTQISNCASYCLFISGGKHQLTHNTIASYFGYPYTTVNIHTTGREDVAAVFLNLLNKDDAPTEVKMYNCIVAGARTNNLVVATPLPEHYTGELAGNYLAMDTLPFPWCHDNVYAQEEDTVFRNIHYLYKEYKDYDFRPDSVSKARGIARPEYTSPYPTDRLGTPRTEPIDAGCYQWTEQR